MKNNPETHRRYWQWWYWQPEIRAKRSAYNKAWKAAHPDRIAVYRERERAKREQQKEVSP